jgi:hypothetical protein
VIESVGDSRAPTPHQLDDATCRHGFKMHAFVMGQMSLLRSHSPSFVLVRCIAMQHHPERLANTPHHRSGVD